MEEFDLGYVVGLFDGEGSISSVVQRSTGYRNRAICLRMTDADSVERFHKAVGYGIVEYDIQEGYTASGRPKKNIHQWRAQGWSEQERFCLEVGPHLNERKRFQVENFLAFPAQRHGAKKGNVNGQGNKGKTVWEGRTHCKHGHDLSVAGIETNSKGYKMCRQCRRDAALKSKHRS